MHVIRNGAQQLFILALISLGVLSLNGCGGGGGITNPALVQKPQVAPAAGTLSLVLTGGAQSANLPSVAGFTESISLPANNAPSGTTLSLTVSNQVPGAMPALAANMYVAQPFLYLTFNSNKTVTLNGYPGFTMTLPLSVHPDNLPVKIGFYDPTSGWKHIGNMTLSGSTATFAPTSGSRIALNAGVNYYAITYTCRSSTIPLAGPGKPMHIPAVAGFDGQFIVPSNNAPEGTMVTLTSFDTKPARAPSPQAINRRGVEAATLSGGTVLFWVSSDYSSSFTFAAFPVTSFDLPEGTNTSGVTFHLETFDGSTLLDQETASSVSGLRVNFPGASLSFPITTGHTYWWELISVPTVTKIYVANFGNSTVTTYKPDGTQTTPTIISGLSFPRGMAVDAAGKIYVANNFNTVTTYNPDGTQTTPTISSGLDASVGVAVDATGKIYVVNAANNTVTTYSPDGTQTTPTIRSGLNKPFGLAVDATGKIYVANDFNNTVTTYKPDGTQTTPTISSGLSGPIGVAVDTAGKIYVVNSFNNAHGLRTVTTYMPDGTQTTPTISGLSDPTGVAVDATGKIYVTNLTTNLLNNSVTTYKPDGTRTTPTISSGLNEPFGVVVH